MRYFLLTIALIMIPALTSLAERVAVAHKVISVKRSIPMTNEEPQSLKDFYTNVGSIDGAQVGGYLNVYRRLPLRFRDPGDASTDLRVLVGQLKIIYVQNDVSIGRIVYVADQKAIPVLDITAVQIGDLVELSSRGGDNLMPIDTEKTAE